MSASNFTSLAHDDAVASLRVLRQRIPRAVVAGNFLASLSGGLLRYRAGLPAWAIASHLPAHGFLRFRDFGPEYVCSICVSNATASPDAWGDRMAESFDRVGGLVSYGDIYQYLAALQLQDTLAPRQPTAADVQKFAALIGFIEAQGEACTPRTLLKALKKFDAFAMDEEQRTALIDTLGFAGILQNPSHPAPLYLFSRLGLAPRKSHSSDWSYPVDWWSGAHGINAHALGFWFPELAR